MHERGQKKEEITEWVERLKEPDIFEWLEKQFEMDERVARSARYEWNVEDVLLEMEDLPDDVYRHIEWFDPERILVEVAIKRRTLNEHKMAVCKCVLCEVSPCDTIRLMTLAYVDRPGFREEWKPHNTEEE